jgi:DNA-binding CsgD family transcriptional regulator
VEAEFNHAKRACYAGLDSVALRHEVADRVARAVPFDAHAFSTCDPDTGIMAHTVAEGIPVALAKTYVEFLYPEFAAEMTMDMPKQGTPVFSMLDESPEVSQAMRAYGITEQLHVSISSGGRLWGTWCLMRAKASCTTSRKHSAFLERLAPHIARGLQSAALVDRGLASDKSSTNGRAPGVLILDSRNRPTLKTPRAEMWLGDLRDIGLAMPDDIPMSVLSLVSRLRTTHTGGDREETLRTRGLSGRLYTLRASLSLPDASGESSIVVVIRPAMPAEVAGTLTQLYGFSTREREIIAAVARGDATKTIAAELGVSPHTVTEHIERACGKLGVRGRKALVAKLYFESYATH